MNESEDEEQYYEREDAGEDEEPEETSHDDNDDVNDGDGEDEDGNDDDYNDESSSAGEMSDEDSRAALFETTQNDVVFSPGPTPSRREHYSEMEMSFCSVMYEPDQVLTRFQLEQLVEKAYLQLESPLNTGSKFQIPQLPNTFLASVLDVVDGIDQGITLERLDQLFQSKLMSLMDQSQHSFTDLEKLLFVRYAVSQRWIRSHDKHLVTIREKEMDLAKNELADQERRLVELVDMLSEKEREIEMVVEENDKLLQTISDLRKQVSTLEEVNSEIQEMVTSTKRELASLQNEHLSYKSQSEKNVKVYEDIIRDKQREVNDLNQQLSKLNSTVSSSNNTDEKVIAKLKNTISEMRKKEDDLMINHEKKRMEDRKWFGNQIMILEADRDMYYNQCCSLQEELAANNQEYERCIKQKDRALDEMKSKLEEVVESLKEQEKQLHSAKKKRKSTSMRNEESPIQQQDDYIGQFSAQLATVDVGDERVWHQLTGLLTTIKKRMEETKNISVLSRHVLFNDTTISPEKSFHVTMTERRRVRSPSKIQEQNSMSPPHNTSPSNFLEVKSSSSSAASGTSNRSRDSPSEIRNRLSPIVPSSSDLLSPMLRSENKELIDKYNETIQSMESQISKLRTDNNTLRSKLEILNVELLKRTERLHILEEERLQQSPLSSTSSPPSRSREVSTTILINHGDDNENDLDSSDEYIRIRRREYESLLAENRELQERYRKKFSRYKKEVASLQSQLDSFARERSTYERRLASLLDEKQETALKLYMARSDLSAKNNLNSSRTK